MPSEHLAKNDKAGMILLILSQLFLSLVSNCNQIYQSTEVSKGSYKLCKKINKVREMKNFFFLPF